MKVEDVVSGSIIALLTAGVKIMQTVYGDRERFTAATARAEIDRILADTSIDEATEQRQWERMRTEKDDQKSE